MAREEEFAATALVEGLTAGMPVGFALVAADGAAVLSSAALAGVAGLSERALADAQRMARMGWWIVWPQSGVAVQSPELLQLTGMDSARERELSEAIRERGRRAIAAGEPLDFQHNVPQGDGTVRTLRVCGDVVERGAEGIALHGFAQDI